MMEPTEIAWAAGLFEGEGCITGSERKVDIHLALVSADEDVVRRFAEAVGTGSVWALPKKAAHHKSLWRWQADGVKAEIVLRQLFAQLGERRRGRAIELLHKRALWCDEALQLRDCAWCETPFRPRQLHSSARRQRFCSDVCRHRSEDSAYRDRRRAAA